MPSYGEFITPPPLSDRPVGKVPPASEEKPKQEPAKVCSRCGVENCKHSK